MSSRYDSRTTTFSPEGRLYQVEYAVEAIQQAGTVIGIRTSEGVVLVAQKTSQHTLFDSENMQNAGISGEKVYKLANHIGCSVAGVTSDAYALINYARLSAQRHYYTFQTPMPTQDLCKVICDEKQVFTQYGGVRPYGVSFLLAGWDRYHGYQLYSTQPSGDYSAWSAYAIGQNDQVAQSYLRKDWKQQLTLQQGKVLGLRVISKTMDTVKLLPEKVEVAVLTKVPVTYNYALLDPYAEQQSMTPKFHIVTTDQLKPLLEEAQRQREAEDAAEAEKERQREQQFL